MLSEVLRAMLNGEIEDPHHPDTTRFVAELMSPYFAHADPELADAYFMTLGYVLGVASAVRVE